MKARAYQHVAINAARGHWANGIRAVLLVAPTGAGKTFLGQELVAGSGRVLWVAHTRELVLQTARRLAECFGHAAVGIIMPGVPARPSARVQVGTVQSLLCRRRLEHITLIVLDEAHHYAALEWRALEASYPHARLLGLTATPQRRDGEPLGDIFEVLVVAANYSELLRDGYLVPSRAYQPPRPLGNDLAQHPVTAWAKFAEGSQTIMYCGRVELAYSYAQSFRDNGVIAETIEAETPKRERDRIIERFTAGKTCVLTNVFALTEGIDIPSTRTVILARSFDYVGGFIQATGRMLRPHPGKSDAILIDLTGATYKHGLPTDDRKYSLSGRGIEGPGGGGGGKPPEWSQEIRGLELKAAPRSVLAMPKVVAIHPVSEHERRGEYERLLCLARRHRMRDGFAAAKYREQYGEEPKMEWTK